MNLLLNIRNFLDSLLRQLIKSKFTSRWVILTLDTFIACLTSLVSYFVCVETYPNLIQQLPSLNHLFFLNFFLVVFFFLIFKTHIGIIRYSSYYEIWRLFLAISAVNVFYYVFVFIFDYNHPVSFTGILLNFTLSLLLLVALRFAIVKVYGRLIIDRGDKLHRAVIFGVSHDSVALAKSILMTKNRDYRLVGFITDSVEVYEKRILDLPVVFLNPELGRVVAGYEIDTLIFPDNRQLILKYDLLIKKCLSSQIRVLISQSPQTLSEYQSKPTRVRNIQIEDLLGRDEITISSEKISLNIADKRVLITGAAGSIGSEIVRQICSFKPSLVILFDSAETPLHNVQLEIVEKFKNVHFEIILGDIRDSKRVSDLFIRFKPEIVFHAAAYKHVPLMESNPCESILVNVFGTKNLANHAIRYNVEKFVMISTDKAVNPTNVMGASKRIAEIYVQSLAKYISGKIDIEFITTRFGNVLGSNGSVIPLFKQQIEKGGPITVTHPEITRYFMTIPEACRLVLEASVTGKNGEIYVFDMGQPVKIDDLARRMIQLAGFVPDVDIEIRYTGLRPGEKLYEELLNDSEITKPTSHDKIMIAGVREYSFRDINQDVDSLICCARLVDVLKTVTKMKQIVPEFVSNNSEFERLDC